MRGSFLALALPLCLLLTLPAFGHETTATSADIALDDKLGQYIPADAVFHDENGSQVNLRAMIDKPTIIAPVYLGCMHECPMLLTGLAGVLGKLDMVRPGRDFKVITLSFDDKDTPAIALDKKRNYLKAVSDLSLRRTGRSDRRQQRSGNSPIPSVSNSAGQRTRFSPYHARGPGARRQNRPLPRGTSFLPFDVTMAVNEAAEGKVSSAGRRMLMYCFSYDPLKKSYVFNILKVVGTAMLLFAGSFFAYLMITTKKKRGSA
jgi:protein SCO1/2